MKTKLILFILGSFLIVTAFILFIRQVTYSPNLKPSSSPAARLTTKKDRTASFELKQKDNSGINASGVVSEIPGGNIKIFVNASGIATNSPTPVFIYNGSCEKRGIIKYALTSIKSGISETILAYDLDTLIAEKPLFLMISKSQKELSKITSCGEIKFPS